MLGFLNTLRAAPSIDFTELVSNGAIVLDVRTKQEYQFGHIRNSINIPLDQLAAKLKKFNKNKVIITCCQSGARSGVAKNILNQNGFEVHNGGGWRRLQKRLN